MRRRSGAPSTAAIRNGSLDSSRGDAENAEKCNGSSRSLLLSADAL